MKKIVILGVVLVLAGCANLQFQWSASYRTDNAAELAKQHERAPERIEVDVQRDAVR